MIEVESFRGIPNVYMLKNQQEIQLLTKNLTPGITVYGENIYTVNNVEYREWRHMNSKLASSMLRDIRIPNLREGSNVLYLGAANGTTVSHVSDIVGESGLIFAVEFSPRSMRDLFNLARIRPNIIPILADARRPEEYAHIVHSVDLVYCDVAQPNQSEILYKNSHAYLKSDGYAFIAIKTRSISQRGKPADIFKKEVKILENNGLKTVKTANISKFHRDHLVFLGKFK